VRVLVGEERHDTVDLALRYLGLGLPEPVPADGQGRLDPAALRERLEGHEGPLIVALQAGNVHSGAFDHFEEAVAVAREHGAWVHVDGAFGLWAAATPAYRHLVRGMADADSWTTDAHKTLNVPYDNGLAVVRDPAALKAAMGMHGEYLVHSEDGEPLDKVPEVSRRGRAFTVWAALRTLGRSGVADLAERLCSHAALMAEGLAAIPGVEVLNDVVWTQVCASFGDDDRTRAVVARLAEDGTVWMTGSRWHDRAVMRVSVSNWSTDDADVERSLEAVRRAVAAV
jgi:glutamate/tyrosine decarboxylase-like PLP-dependent enzyme